MSSLRRDSRLANTRNGDTSNGDTGGCQELSALVMALFDGETDELQTRRARNHLLICQTCANRWLDWNRARSLLLEVPAPAPPETLVWRVLTACRGAASHRSAPLKTGQAPLNSNHVLTATDVHADFVPVSLSDQILARTSRAEMRAEANSKPSFSRRTQKLAWPVAVPAAALWLLILQREPLLLARFEAKDAAPTPAVSRPLRSSVLNEVSNAAPSTFVPRNRTGARLAPVSTARPTRARVVAPQVPQTTSSFDTSSRPSPASVETASMQSDLGDGQAASEANNAVLQRKWQEIEALTSDASRSVEWQTVAFNPGTSRRNPARDNNSNAFFSKPLRAPSRANVVTAMLPKAALSSSHRAARLSSEGPSLNLRAARWRNSTPRGVSLIDTSLPPTMPSRVSLPAASAPSSARLIAENFDTEAGRIDEMRSVVDDFRATVAPDETQNPDEENEDLG